MQFGPNDTAFALLVYVALFAFVAIVTLVSFGVAGALMLKPVDRKGAGFALGALLGPIGLVIAWTMRSNELLERAEYAERHRATPPNVTAPVQLADRPSWAPEEPPRRFR